MSSPRRRKEEPIGNPLEVNAFDETVSEEKAGGKEKVRTHECNPCANQQHGIVVCVNGEVVVMTPPDDGGPWYLGYDSTTGEWDFYNATQIASQTIPPESAERAAVGRKKKVTVHHVVRKEPKPQVKTPYPKRRFG